MTKDEALKLALEALQFALHVGFDESSERQIKKGDKASQQHRQAITAIKEALAQPEQEPVAYWNFNSGFSHCMIDQLNEAAKKNPAPLYTTPLQRKPLSDDEIWEIAERSEDNHFSFARAIEAAHGIKGEA